MFIYLIIFNLFMYLFSQLLTSTIIYVQQ